MLPLLPLTPNSPKSPKPPTPRLTKDYGFYLCRFGFPGNILLTMLFLALQYIVHVLNDTGWKRKSCASTNRQINSRQ
jgi:hypothetical protein